MRFHHLLVSQWPARNMADTKRRHGPIIKGMKLAIVVEDAIDDVIVVCLEHGSRMFRGVLLDAKKRNLPHGICTSFGPQGDGNKAVRRSNSQGVQSPSQNESHVDMPACIFRNTYGQNMAQVGSNVHQQTQPVYRQPLGSKTVRNIRLRPRQTLCSKCKAVCLDSAGGPVPVRQSTKPQVNGSHKNSNQSQPKNDQKVYPTRLIAARTVNTDNPEPDQPVSVYPTRLVQNVYPTRLEQKKRRATIETETLPPTKQLKIDLERVDEIDGTRAEKLISSSSNLTKTSPFIKISVGQGTVVNIPPRIHEEKETEDVSSEEKGTDDDTITITSNLDEENSKDEEERSSYKKHKKAAKKSKDREHKYSTEISEESKPISYSSHHKKHKKRHRHKHASQEDMENPVVREVSALEQEEENAVIEKNENSEPNQTEVITQRPRLLYTWRQNKGLSPRRDYHSNIREEVYRPVKPLSPQRENQNSNIEPKYEIVETSKTSERQISCSVERKEYKLRSREKSNSLDSSFELNSSSESNNVSYEDAKSESDQSGESVSGQSSGSDSDSSEYEDGPPGDENLETLRPLMMKIQTTSVARCVTTDGRRINIGDIVWGKIQGFPWWPGRVLSITISQRESGVIIRQLAHVAWFGSSTMSHIQCSDLFPFLEDFKLRYKRKKRGPYKMAIKQATIAAQLNSTNPHNIDFTELDL